MTDLTKKLLKLALKKKIMISVAESCTGGIVASSITSVAGSSDVFDRGFITYSYEAKSELLGVDKNLILEKGAVSQEVAEAMSVGALKNSHSQLSVAITGIAGPSGGTENKPVGLVHFASNLKGSVIHKKMQFTGDRAEVRKKASEFALKMLIERLEASH